MMSAPNTILVNTPGVNRAGSDILEDKSGSLIASAQRETLPQNNNVSNSMLVDSDRSEQNPQQQQRDKNKQISMGVPSSSGTWCIGSTAVSDVPSCFQERLFSQASRAVDAVLAASCEAVGFDIAEMWLRTGPKTHQLTNSHLRPTALEDSVRDALVEVYYGERSNARTHRLSPALCKKAKEAKDVVWVTANSPLGAEALKVSINDVQTAVAIPICHETSGTNMTIIFFSIRRSMMKSEAVEFLIHMALAAGVASVNSLAEDMGSMNKLSSNNSQLDERLSKSEHLPGHHYAIPSPFPTVSVTGAHLDLKWNQLKNVEYLTDGGNSWIHTGVFEDKPVVIKTLKPECQDVALAINEIEAELAVHSKLNHPNIVSLIGAGLTTRGIRFIVLERLDGGTLSQILGYDNRIRDRRRRFWKRKHFSYSEVLNTARSVADAMAYTQGRAIPGGMCLHRDLKPDNIGFTLDGSVKIIDFGLATILDKANPHSEDVYQMSGETGSLRYMAPEVAECLPYNHKADVYSFGIILWEMNACKKPFDGMNRETFYECVVHGGERPVINKKWPLELAQLMKSCWSVHPSDRPTFDAIVDQLDDMIAKEKRTGFRKKRGSLKKNLVSRSLDNRHSTWF